MDPPLPITWVAYRRDSQRAGAYNLYKPRPLVIPCWLVALRAMRKSCEDMADEGSYDPTSILAWDQAVDAHEERHKAAPENRVVDDLWASHYNVIHSGARMSL